MRISIFGLGYVGCVSAACLARDGHEVIGVDVNPQKIALLETGRSPIVEPGLDELLGEAVATGRLKVTTDSQPAVLNSEISLICVGTPSRRNGSLETRFVEKVCSEIGSILATKQGYHAVVVRSTVLPGTIQKRCIPLLEQLSGRCAGVDLGVGINPEFLREGSAIQDYDRPSQIVIGATDLVCRGLIAQLYDTIDAPIAHSTLETAEMVKYASNAFHALKVAFANEIGNFCKLHSIDGQELMEIFVQDRQLNVSSAYLRPGFAFGGSCLPKDLRAILHRAKECDLALPLLEAVLTSNEHQIRRGVEMVERTGRKKVGVFGLSFKPGTDDVRESPTVLLVETLVGRGYQVNIYDETVKPDQLIGANKAFLERELPHIATLMRPTIAEVLQEADVLAVMNRSQAFRNLSHHLRPEQILIDFTGANKAHRATNGSYEGICW